MNEKEMLNSNRIMDKEMSSKIDEMGTLYENGYYAKYCYEYLES